jgi:cellulose synthase/poly-beta-1,6-N-acetylglucosamine synthase-like glycosyltransferase
VFVLLTVAFFLAATLFSGLAVRAIVCLRFARPLPDGVAAKGPARPRCSVIFAARDESARVEETLRRILALEGIDLEVIPVDDRSRDETSQILKRISAEDPRVKPKRIDLLPENWLGKCHACHVGAQSASGDWLLFTDADCWLKPEVVWRAIAAAEREGVQHITLMPGVSGTTLPAQGCHIAFLLMMIDWIANTNRDKPNAHVGIGAFNLVRTETYRKFGGYEALRLTVLDDVKFGRLVRRAGGRTRAYLGSREVECHWGNTARHLIKVMEKNYFAAVNFRVSLGVLVGIVLPMLWVASLAGPMTGTFLGWAAMLAVFSMCVPALVIARRVGFPTSAALITPLVFPILYYAMFNSMLVTLRQGGVRWRDTFYPLELLRKGTVR